MIEMLEGRYFKTFITVLEEKSISRAAEKLGYVQSTVTSHIQHLEKISRKKLFDRLTRGVEPTEAGLELAQYAYQFLRLGQSLQVALERTEVPRGELRLCALESFVVAQLPKLISQFLQKYTRVRMHLTTGLMPEVIEQVVQQRADLGIVPRDPQHPTLLFTPLMEERLVLVCSPDLYKRVHQNGWKTLNDLPFISFGEQCVYQAFGHDVLHSVDLHPTAHLFFPSIELIKQTVCCGMGIAFVPESNVQKEINEWILCKLHFERDVKLTHGYIRHKDIEPKVAAKVFSESLISHFE